MGKRSKAAQSVREKKLGDRVYEVAPGVYRLPMPTDFSVGDVNVYFVDGPEPVLIDTGVSGARTIECLEQSLSVLGRSVGEIKSLLLTHTHVDHAGSVQKIRERSLCDVYVHPRAHDYLSDVDAWWLKSVDWFRNFFVGSGFDAERMGMFSSARKIVGAYAESCSELHAVEQGDVLTLAGGRRFAVHEVFGHTTDHVVYVLEDVGVVFTADHLLPRISANPTLEPPHPFDSEKAKPLVLYQESLKRTEALPAEIACPGHGRAFRNISGRCQEIARHQLERCEQIFSLIESEPGVHRKDLSLKVFGKMPSSEIYLTLSEISAGTEFLAFSGRIASEFEKDVERYTIL
jgi:glyoxylase-like metal-dependent hydrolase (beta-lactamase superfamily II)